jgi:hypothetical protein
MTLRSQLSAILVALTCFFGNMGTAIAQSYHQVCWGTDLSQYANVLVNWYPEDCLSWYRSRLYVNGQYIGRVGNGDLFGSGHCEGGQVNLGRVSSVNFSAQYEAGWGGNPFNPSFSGECSPSYEDSHTNQREGYFTIYVQDVILPSLSVSKTVSSPYFAVGAGGQTYTITIGINNGPTTQAIAISDTLPAGMTTSGTITSNTSLYGCPGSETIPAANVQLNAAFVCTTTMGFN